MALIGSIVGYENALAGQVAGQRGLKGDEGNGITSISMDENFDLVIEYTKKDTDTVDTGLDAYDDLLKGYKNDAVSAKNDAVSAKNDAVSAKNDAVSAKNDAVSAKNDAVSAKNDAQSAKNDASAYSSSAASSASSASADALVSEGYALGKQNGSNVGSGSTYYHNNSKYYADESSSNASDAYTYQNSAASSASDSKAYAIGKRGSSDVTSSDPAYHNNSKYYSEQSSTFATNASGSATSAGTEALKAEGYAVGKQNGTDVASGSPYYENNAKYYADEAATSAASFTVDSAMSTSSTNPVQNKVITGKLATKAEIDGAYAQMTVGNAEQLVSTMYEEDSVPYNFRTSGGSTDIGDREYDEIVGGTVAWNQLCVNGNFGSGVSSWNGRHGTVSASNGVLTVTTTESNTQSGITCANNVGGIRANHKYLFFCEVNSPISSNLQMSLSGGSPAVYPVVADTWTKAHGIWKYGADFAGAYPYFLIQGNIDSGLQIQFKNLMCFNLTQMFGSTIADYIYTLETNNAGAGVAWFRKLFPKPYYANNTGELMSVNASSHNTVGFNAWDEEWEEGGFDQTNGDKKAFGSRIRSKNKIPCTPSTTYYFASVKTYTSWASVYFYDAAENYLGYTDLNSVNRTFSTPQNCHYINFNTSGTYGSTYNNDICINLHWDGERDGEYEEYVKHEYALDSSLTLRGIPKLDANNNLYYDGDTYESDGTVTRKRGKVILNGSNDQSMSSLLEATDTVRVLFTSAVFSPPAKTNASDVTTIISTYPTYAPDVIYKTANDFVGISENKNISQAGLWLRVKKSMLSSYDYAGVRAYLSANPITVEYELATPTTESADSFQSPQIVDDFGTEEYVDYAYSQNTRDVAIPVGHNTKYAPNLRAKLEMSPDSPSGNGDYIVRQTDGTNEYVAISDNSTISGLTTRVPACPTDTDGTYKLTCTVSGGVAVYSWEA